MIADDLVGETQVMGVAMRLLGLNSAVAFWAAVLVSALAVSQAQALVLNFDGASNGDSTPYVEDGLQFDVARIVNGNCPSNAERPCMALNNNEVSVLTRVGGGTFTISSFWFQLLGNGTDNTLMVMSDLGGNVNLPQSVWGNNDGGQVFDLAGQANFSGVSSLTFSTNNGGNVRLDNFDIAAVPLPAAGWLLVGALGALGVARRRRTS